MDALTEDQLGITRRSAEYLLHFERPYKPARHYLGFAEDLERRLGLHRAGRGARLVEVVVAGVGPCCKTTKGGGT